MRLGAWRPLNSHNPAPLTLAQIPHLRLLLDAANSADPNKNSFDLARVMWDHVDMKLLSALLALFQVSPTVNQTQY